MPTKNVETAGSISLSAKSIFSQLLAGSAQNLLLLDLGMAISFSTLVIPALLGAKEGLSFTVLEASWFGSINFILQPVGSILSGLVLEPLGRKRALLIVNIPHIIAWLMMYFAQNVAMVFCANALLGLGTGFMEAPILTYIGEISHPSIRGTLTAYSQLFSNTGILAAYFFGLFMDWRTAAASCLVVPITTFIAVLFIPETPIWLLSRGRKDDALKALCWLRGWTQPSNVQDEFNDLIIYQETSMKCDLCSEENSKSPETIIMKCGHNKKGILNTVKTHFKNVFRKEVLRPLSIIVLMFFFQQTTGVWGTKPNMVNIFNAFGMAIDGHLAAVASGALGLMGAILAMSLVKQLGKRFLTFTSLFVCALCTLLLGIFAYKNIPNVSSFEPITNVQGFISWLPTLLFGILNLFSSLGINTTAWLMISEIFPLRGRGMACGIGAASCYIIGTAVSKTYYDLEVTFRIYGAMWFYTCCSGIGIITLYFLMPETEGKPVNEIESYFEGEYMPIFSNDAISNRIFKKRKICNNSPLKTLSGIVNNCIDISTIEGELQSNKGAIKTENCL